MSLGVHQRLRWFTFRMTVLWIPMNLSASHGLRWFAFRMTVLWVIHKHPAASVLAIIALLALVAAVALSLAHGPGASCPLMIIQPQGRLPRWALACESQKIPRQ